ncbi:DUF378 domain-containing protein [Oceanobacillus sp. CAU 1775]
MHTLRRIALALVIIGAVNWGLIGLFQFDLVASLFGGQEAGLSRIIYTLVGISGLICLSFYFDPETADGAADRRGMRTTQPGFGTEFANEFDPESEVDKNNQPPRD